MFDKLEALKKNGLSLQKAACLARTATAGDATFFQQCHFSPSEVHERNDINLIEAHGKLLDVTPAELNSLGAGAITWFLPWREGGFGLQSSQLSAPGIYLSAWLRDVIQIADHLKYTSAHVLLNDVGSLRASFNEAEAKLTDLGVDFSAGLATHILEPSKFQAKKWKVEIHSRISSSISSDVNSHQSICMLEAGGTGAGAWLKFLSKAYHYMTNIEFSVASRLRMALPVFNVLANSSGPTCSHRNREGACGAAMEQYGTHALLCKRGGHVIYRHDGIRDILAEELKTKGLGTVLIEQNAPDTPEHLLRPDIVFHDDNGRVKHLDVEVTTMHQGRVQGEHRAGVLIERGEGVKRRKYAHLALIP